MRKPVYKKNTHSEPQGKMTVNIFAIFISLFVFLFVQQGGILLLNVMFGLNYPNDVSRITNFFGTTIFNVVLIFVFGVGLQMGYGIIRRVKADTKIFIAYNMVTLLILVIQGLGVALAISPLYTVPNIVLGIATVYSTYTTIKGVPDRVVGRIRKLK